MAFGKRSLPDKKVSGKASHLSVHHCVKFPADRFRIVGVYSRKTDFGRSQYMQKLRLTCFCIELQEAFITTCLLNTISLKVYVTVCPLMKDFFSEKKKTTQAVMP